LTNKDVKEREHMEDNKDAFKVGHVLVGIGIMFLFLIFKFLCK